MNRIYPWLLCILALLLTVGCGDSSSTNSKSSSGKAYVHEREFAKNSDLYAEPDQVVVLYLESPDQAINPQEDTGTAGRDRIPIRYPRSYGHVFHLDIPAGEDYSLVLYDPSGYMKLALDRDTPQATVDLPAGDYVLEVIHGGAIPGHRGLFIRPGSTMVGPDCPGCVLSGADLSGHNFSGADFTGADLMNADFSHANLSRANLSGADTAGTDFTNADMTGTVGSCPQVLTNTTGGSDYFLLAPANDCYSYTTDHTIISLYQSNSTGSQICQNGVTATGNEPAVWAKLGTGYWVARVEDSFWKQTFGCLIQTTGGPSPSWKAVPNAQGLTEGCQYIAETAATSYLLPASCIPNDNSVNSYPRVYLLDKMNGNLLFRGSEPCVKKKDGEWIFDYDNLMQVLRSRFKTQVTDGSTFPETFRFIDISLISDVSEKDMLQAEYVFFGGTTAPQPYPATLPLNDYFALPEPKGTTATVSGQFWWRNRPPCVNGIEDNQGIDELVDEIAANMDTQGAIPYVIYFHCEAGSDRTGEVAISYLLKHRDLAPSEAYIYGTTIFEQGGSGGLARSRQNPPPVPNYLDCAQDYCTKQCPAEDNCDYESMGIAAVPGTGKYANCPYPWSPGCTWEAGCF